MEKEKSYCPNCFLPMKSNQVGAEHQNDEHAWLMVECEYKVTEEKPPIPERFILKDNIEKLEERYIELGALIRGKQLRLAELEGRSDVEPEINKCSQCGADTHLKGEAVISCGAAIDKLLRSIQQSVKRYHLALDQRQHGAVAADKLVNEVHEALGMVYEPGTTLKLLNERPDLIKYYTCSKEDKL